jgi:hypothetical protein
MHVARLIAITELRNVSSDIRPFIDFKAAVEDRKLDDKDLVAVLNIDTTSCYVPVFLKDPVTMEQLEDELRRQDAQLSTDSRDVLAPRMKK